MFATIRRYTITKGSLAGNDLEEFRRRLHDEFLPLAQGIEGFHGYYAVSAGERELVTVSLFETRKGAAESTRRAADYRGRTKLPLEMKDPEVIEGEVLVSAEAGVGAR